MSAQFIKENEATDALWRRSVRDTVNQLVGKTALSGTVRPQNPSTGLPFFDQTLGKPVWWTGTKWVDATGAAA